MKTKILYIVSLIIIAIPWLFLMEAFPIAYSQISTAAEVTAEGIMFLALLAVVVFLKKELKRQKAGAVKGKSEHSRNTGAGNKTDRLIGRVLFVLAALTLFLVGLVLVLIAISFSL